MLTFKPFVISANSIDFGFFFNIVFLFFLFFAILTHHATKSLKQVMEDKSITGYLV